ncbi:MAG: DUF4249 domain-containing protein [Bacteroidia bacterium]|nr:DUF4249 domain-containing protein [Bacteroidia bacterium]
MKKLLYIIMAAAAVCACEMDFEVDAPTSSKIYLQCLPGANDTTIIQLYPTVPVGVVYKGSELLDDAEVDFRVNGVSCDVKHADEKTGSVMKGCWYITDKIVPEDVVDVRAKAEGLAEIHATAAIPSRFPQYNFNYSGKAVTVEFKDDPSTEDYYGMIVYCECTTDSEHVHKVETVGLEPTDDAEGLWGASLSTNYLDVPFCGWAYGYFRTVVRVWSDDKSNGKDMKLTLNLGSAYFGAPSYLDEDGKWHRDEVYTQTIRYKLRLYRFSKEFYSYALALDNIENNRFSSIGLAPATYAYSNVENGVGILAGCSMVETDWFE